ncbi:APC family permease [Brevibacterium casei]|uniref:APC family permease n=1 Tax=Brevibacterium casei TaxID=33889 RepID=UPI000E64E68C|nr:APC family permease [Brevibacterium casei]
MAPSAPTETTSPSSRRGIGTPGLVFFVLAAAAPLTILAGFVPLGMLAGGDAIVLGFLYPGLVYLLFAVGYTTIARHVPGGGAFLTYIAAGLGARTGSVAGMIAYVGYLGGQIGFTASASVFASFTIETLTGIRLHWLPIAVVITALVLILGLRRVGVGAATVAVLLIAECAILAVFAVAVLVQGGYEGLTLAAFAPEKWVSAALPGVFVLTFTAFVGFEQTTVYRTETRAPNRTIPRATYLAVAILLVGYTFGAWVILQAAGQSRVTALLAGDPSELVFTLNDEFVGPAATAVMLILVVTSFIAGVIALQNTSARYLVNLARGGLLPGGLSRLATSGSPLTANFVQAGLVLIALVIFAAVGADPYTQIVTWTNTPTIIAVLVLQILTSISVVSYFRRNRRRETRWTTAIAPALAAVLVTVALVLLIAQMGALTGLGPAGNACVIAPLVLAGAYGLLRARRVHPGRATLATLGAETIDPADRPDPRPENPTPDHHSSTEREG